MKFSETDVLLQKVSDTLSNSLPVSSSNDVSVENPEAIIAFKETDNTGTKKSTSKQNLQQQSNDFPDGTIVNTSTPNLTVNSQQDTSDYVSATGGDLSITDWEYQLPAPPSAFRDSASPVFDSFEEVTSSPETFRTPEIIEKRQVPRRDLHSSLENPSERKEFTIEKTESVEKKVKPEKVQEKPFREQRSSDCNLRKEVICELENKIGTLPQSIKDFESKRAVENLSTPKIAPIDNTLSNFTITTYNKQKSLNIFEENEEQSRKKGSSDDRFIKSFATLSRSRNSEESENKSTNNFSVGTLQGKRNTNTSEDDKRLLEPKMQMDSLQRWQARNEKSNIQRSKSYVSVCEKPKIQGNTSEDEDTKSTRKLEDAENIGMKKATSITNLNLTAPKSNEKFSQWRENILKRQEEPTKEKQLQSLQVDIFSKFEHLI